MNSKEGPNGDVYTHKADGATKHQDALQFEMIQNDSSTDIGFTFYMILGHYATCFEEYCILD